MQGFFKLSNDIFEYKLSPKAFITFSYMCCKANRLKSLVAKCEDIAEACNLCRQSVMSAITELVDARLIAKNNRYNSLGYKASSFSILHSAQKTGWFKIEPAVFETSIAPSDFMVYAFIKKCMFNKTQQAFPSLNYISQHTYLSHRRVCQAVKWLRQYCFLNRIKRILRTLQHIRNKYMHFKFGEKGTKRKKYTALHPCTSSKPINVKFSSSFHNSIISYIHENGNMFLPWGVVQNFNNSS